MQRKSLEWIREQSLDPNCVVSLATHDPDVEPQVIELKFSREIVGGLREFL